MITLFLNHAHHPVGFCMASPRHQSHYLSTYVDAVSMRWYQVFMVCDCGFSAVLTLLPITHNLVANSANALSSVLIALYTALQTLLPIQGE